MAERLECLQEARDIAGQRLAFDFYRVDGLSVKGNTAEQRHPTSKAGMRNMEKLLGENAIAC